MGKGRIGEFLVERGVLNTEEVAQILSYGKQNNLRFCEAGLHLKILTRRKLVDAFAPGFNGDFFDLDPKRFPAASASLLSVEEILRLGAIPIGFRKEKKILGPSRRRILNLGLLDPSKHGLVVETLDTHEYKDRRKPFRGTHVYLILADQFLEILESVYGVREEQIMGAAHDGVDETLRRFLNCGEISALAPSQRLKLVA